jgi:hypothetical protein
LPWCPAGPEKAALNLVPLQGGGHLDGFFCRLAMASFAVCLLGGALIGLYAPVMPYAAAGVFAAGLGSATVHEDGAGPHRVRSSSRLRSPRPGGSSCRSPARPAGGVTALIAGELARAGLLLALTGAGRVRS